MAQILTIDADKLKSNSSLSLTGATGPKGEDGTSPHIDGTTGNWFVGEIDTTIAAQGPRGATGADGQGITISGSKATYGDLPNDLTSGDAGKAFLVEADGLLYIWDGTAFPADGNGIEFRGPIGETGATGATGGTGPRGNPGLSAFEVAQENGWTGDDEEAWLASLKGDPGTNGTTGARGEQGIQGNAGATGPQGNVGNTGIQGPPGNNGLDGGTGPKGDTGTQGIQGNTGPEGPPGPKGEGIAFAGSVDYESDLDTTGAGLDDTSISEGGDVGKGYYVIETGNLHIWMGSVAGWSDPIAFRGERGATGSQGIQGIQGIKGDTGERGLQGNTGQGIQGEQGIQGIQGERGVQGIEGPMGPPGAPINIMYRGIWHTNEWLEEHHPDIDFYSYYDYVIHTTSLNETNGYIYIADTNGLIAEPGTAGSEEIWGVFVMQGPQGREGVQGATGTQGIQGETGATGTQGPKGDTGTQGPAGVVAIYEAQDAAEALTYSQNNPDVFVFIAKD